MSKKFDESKYAKYIHWNVASWMGLLGIAVSVLTISMIFANLFGGSELINGLLALQFVFAAISLFLLVDATFLRKNSTYIAESTLLILLTLIYVIVEVVYAFKTRDNTLAYIAAHPEAYASDAAKQTAVLTAENLCRDQCIFYFISLPLIIGVGVMGFVKMLNGETRTINYVFFGLSIFFVFMGSYQYANVLNMLANFNNAALTKLIEARSPVLFIVCAGVTSFNSDYDPLKDEKLIAKEGPVAA